MHLLYVFLDLQNFFRNEYPDPDDYIDHKKSKKSINWPFCCYSKHVKGQNEEHTIMIHLCNSFIVNYQRFVSFSFAADFFSSYILYLTNDYFQTICFRLFPYHTAGSKAKVFSFVAYSSSKKWAKIVLYIANSFLYYIDLLLKFKELCQDFDHTAG